MPICWRKWPKRRSSTQNMLSASPYSMVSARCRGGGGGGGDTRRGEEWSPGVLASVRTRVSRNAVAALRGYALRRAKKRRARMHAGIYRRLNVAARWGAVHVESS
jgi:hypothetical protein